MVRGLIGLMWPRAQTSSRTLWT